LIWDTLMKQAGEWEPVFLWVARKRWASNILK
jgi:hypothetical protein